MLPPEQVRGGLPSQIGLGELESSNTMAAPASCGVAPTNAADLYSCVVPVFAAIGRFHPVCPAAAAEVPPAASSFDRPVMRVSAIAGSSACRQAACVTDTG